VNQSDEAPNHGLLPGISRPKNTVLTFSADRAMIAIWMLAVALLAAGFLWYGIASWEHPSYSIASLGWGIFLILLSISRIVREEIKRGGDKENH
jgi:hypothetical protein